MDDFRSAAVVHRDIKSVRSAESFFFEQFGLFSDIVAELFRLSDEFELNIALFRRFLYVLDKQSEYSFDLMARAVDVFR